MDTSPPIEHRGFHKGRYVWKNSAEFVWECADACPHPSHDDEAG